MTEEEKTKIVVSITGGGGKRNENDFYPTPPECTTSLLHKELSHFKGMTILEPCCGDGAISKLLISAGLDVISSDLNYSGYGLGDTDFLTMTSTPANAIITNPPFNLAEAFIRKGFELGIKDMAFLLKSTYWHSKRRLVLFNEFTPATIYPMTWRPDFNKRGAPTMDFMWCVWRSGSTETTFVPMEKKV